MLSPIFQVRWPVLVCSFWLAHWDYVFSQMMPSLHIGMPEVALYWARAIGPPSSLLTTLIDISSLEFQAGVSPSPIWTCVELSLGPSAHKNRRHRTVLKPSKLAAITAPCEIKLDSLWQLMDQCKAGTQTPPYVVEHLLQSAPACMTDDWEWWDPNFHYLQPTWWIARMMGLHSSCGWMLKSYPPLSRSQIWKLCKEVQTCLMLWRT